MQYHEKHENITLLCRRVSQIYVI